MKNSPFSGTALVLLLAAAIVMFALSILLPAYDNSAVSSGSKARPDSFSTSALGHAGWYDIMRRLDRPVSRSTGNTLAQVGSRGTLVMAEPELDRITTADGQKVLNASKLLLVLPKWRGTTDQDRPAWVSEVRPALLDTAQQTLGLISMRAKVFRTEWPEIWQVNEVGFQPTGSGVVQLMRSRDMRPIVGNKGGMLVGEIIDNGRRIWVISDPDVLSNHGIGKGENAAFIVELVDMLRLWGDGDMRAPVVFDETVHGYHNARNSPLKMLFSFPFVVVTLLIFATAVLLALAGTSRFGAPQSPKPELDFGKAKLIDNGARLLDYAGHHAVILKRYVRMTVRSVAHSLHAPSGLDEPALAAWLDRIGKSRGVSLSCADILRAADTTYAGDGQNLARLLESAGDIHRWKGEILNGS